MFLILHSYEIVFILFIFSFKYGAVYFWHIFFPVLLHMILDTSFNPVKKWGYFFIYRAYHKFHPGKSFDLEYFDCSKEEAF